MHKQNVGALMKLDHLWGALDSPMEDQISGGIIMSKTALGGLLLCTYGGPKIQKPPKGGTDTPLHVWGI